MARQKRSTAQLVRDRARVAELKLLHHTDLQISEILGEETGVMVSRRQISYDMQAVRQGWRDRSVEAYNELVNTELARIDATERRIWDEIRMLATTDREKEIIKKARKRLAKVVDGDDDEEYGLVVMEETKSVEKAFAIPPAYFSQVIECQKERRRLLGLYAPKTFDVQKTVVVKGYGTVSPDEWPDAIEGHVIKD